jgi:polysaccharide export outer membrane protein
MTVRLNQPIRSLILASFALGAVSASPASAQFMGPAVAAPPLNSSATSPTPAPDFTAIRIEPGDILSITTVGAPELTTTTQTSSGSIASGPGGGFVQGIKVGEAGEITLPYLGSVKVAGLTPAEASRFLADALQKGGFLVEPEISVQLVDSPTRAITVLGEVLRPAPIPAFGHIRLLDALSACGGLTPLASHAITIRRQGNADPILVELGTDARTANAGDIPLMPGDTVIVSRVGSVFVLGYVKTPQAIPLSGNAPITVLRALTMAGGINYGAGLSKARIIRTTADNQQVEIRLDLRKIMFGKQQDVALVSNDILLVPANAFKAGMASAGAGLVSSVIYGAVETAAVLK